MQCTFQVGDQVTPIIDGGWLAQTIPERTYRPIDFPQYGNIYVIQRMDVDRGMVYLHFADFPEDDWHAAEFRHVLKTDISVFQDIARREIQVERTVVPVREDA